jgi:serpin B
MKKIAVALILAFSLILSGCDAQPAVNKVSYGKNLMADIHPKAAAVGQVTADSTAFAVNLLKAAYDGGNTVISLVSAYIALSMVANGASGETLKEFENVLGAPVDELNSTCKALMEALNKASDGLTLKTVNGIWYNTEFDFKPNPDFLQKNADYFGAAEIASDFSNPKTLKAINKFVSDNTNKLIPSILDRLDFLDVMILVNTLYFKGNWGSPFKPEDTANDDFTTADGNTVDASTMEKTYDSILYFDNGGTSGVVLPYQDNRFAYVAILPAGNIREYLSGFTATDLKSFISSATDKKVQLYIPKYEVTGDFNLNEILKLMGLRLAFDPVNADFSALDSSPIGNIYTDKVLQKVVFKLNEKGTEATAATTVVMKTTSMPIQQDDTITLRLDHPFIYALVDMETMTPLFMGVMTDPTAAEGE